MTTEQLDQSLDLKSRLFDWAQSTGLFRIGRYLQRNRGQLLILCYHGISKSDEHRWCPTLYMPRSLFRQRLQTLQNFGYQVLPLTTALDLFVTGSLTQPTVVLTFDDGWHDFYTEAWPELRSFGYPATVYQTTYYSLYQKPVFDTACSYLLWKGRGQTLQDRALTGTEQAFALDSSASLRSAFEVIAGQLRCAKASAEEKDGLLAQLAAHLGIEWGPMLQFRLLHLMTLSEVAEISRNGMDVQLHTHRHRLPSEKNAFLNEIRHNQELLEAATGRRAVHFCYPNGEYRREWPDWLREAGVVSATTCEPGLVTRRAERLLLPRAVDSCTVSSARFESWLSGLGLWFSAYKRKAQFRSGHCGRSSTQTTVSHEREQAGTIGQRAAARAVEGR